jgi:hypothetical protein
MIGLSGDFRSGGDDFRGALFGFPSRALDLAERLGEFTDAIGLTGFGRAGLEGPRFIASVEKVRNVFWSEIRNVLVNLDSNRGKILCCLLSSLPAGMLLTPRFPRRGKSGKQINIYTGETTPKAPGWGRRVGAPCDLMRPALLIQR